MSNVSHVVTAAHRSDWLQTAGRFGYFTKGAVYALIAFFAAQAAWQGGRAGGTQEAIAVIGQQTYGQILLLLTAAGLLGYAGWRAIEAIAGPASKAQGKKRLLLRAGCGASAIAYGLLAWTTVTLAIVGRAARDGEANQDAAAQVLSLPGGKLLLAICALVVLGVGCHQLYRAYTAGFMEHYKLGEMSEAQRNAAFYAGRVGLAARGIAFLMIAGSVFAAAAAFDAGKVQGLGEALQTLARQPYGPWLLGAMAVGLLGYAIHCVMEARYRRFPA